MIFSDVSYDLIVIEHIEIICFIQIGQATSKNNRRCQPVTIITCKMNDKNTYESDNIPDRILKNEVIYRH